MRSKKIILVAHCVLNQNAVIKGWERAPGAFSAASALLDSGAGIIQLPCPELCFGGLNRPSCTVEDYDTPEYRALCEKLAGPVVSQVAHYVENGYDFRGILGIHESPSCGLSGQRGVFMEVLLNRFEKAGIQAPFIEIPESLSDFGPDGSPIPLFAPLGKLGGDVAPTDAVFHHDHAQMINKIRNFIG